MKLNVNFSELELACAKMRGLDAYLSAIRNTQKTYSEGLKLAKQYVLENEGEALPEDENGITVLKLLGDNASCFQHYSDIDRFYYELSRGN